MSAAALPCPVCGTRNPEGKSFCSSCGERLEAPPPQPNPGEVEGRRRFRWPIAIAIFLALAIAGAAAGYFAGTRDSEDSAGLSSQRDDSGQSAGSGNYADGAGGTAEQPVPQLLCRIGSYPDYELVLQTEPSECEVLSEGAPIDAPTAGTAFVLDLDWIEWGPESATADGEYFVSSAGPRPVTVRLSDPRLACGELVFSEFSATPVNQSPTGRSLTIETCPPGGSSSGESATGAALDEFDTGDGPVAEIPPIAEGEDAFIIKPGQSCPPGWEKRTSKNNQTGQIDTSCRRLAS